ncbi:hypothetical protein CsatA_020355 [Cannabis sativa]
MKLKRFLSIPILGVFLLLGFVYYITIFIFIEDWIGLQSSSGSLNALIFTFLTAFSIFSFSVCVLTDPGQVPSSYAPDVEQSGISDEETKRKVRDIQTSEGSSLPSLQKMYFKNGKELRIIVITCAFQKDWDFNGHIPLKVFYVICGVMMSALSLTLGTLFGWHIYLIIHNMTTIEVLGPNMLKWWCPTAVSHLKDGLTFPVIRDNS